MVFYHPASVAGLDPLSESPSFILYTSEVLRQAVNLILEACIRMIWHRPLSRHALAECITDHYLPQPGCTSLRGLAVLPIVPPGNPRDLHAGISSPEGVIYEAEVLLVHPDTARLFLPLHPPGAGGRQVNDVKLVMGTPVCLA